MRMRVADPAEVAAWSVDMLRRGGVGVTLVQDAPLPEQAPAAVAAYVARLGERLESWLPVPPGARWQWQSADGAGLPRLHAFFEACGSRPTARVLSLRRKVEERLRDHRRDLEALWTDEAALAALPSSCRDAWRQRADAVLPRLEQDRLTLDEVQLTLLMGAHKARAWPGLPCPWFARYDGVDIEIGGLSALTREVLGLAAAPVGG